MRLTIPFTGTLGILAILVKQQKITLIEGNSWLQQMIDTGYHSPMLKLDELVKT
jgi:predicted nucleic acid-binding protein